LATIYRDLAQECITAATVLEKSTMPFRDNFPALDPALFANAVKAGGVMHFLLDTIQRAKDE